MTGASGEDRRTGPDGSPRWLLHCRGMHVEDQHGHEIGTVLAPIYEHSARWDRPAALDVQGPDGNVTVPLEWVARVDESAGRVIVGRDGSGLPREDTPPRQ
jgi:hypothetical protein